MVLDQKVMEYFRYIINDLNKIEFTCDKKNLLYVPLFSAAIDHSLSIHVLDKEGLTVSAFALARPAVESYLRAMWVEFYLDEDDIDEGCLQLHFPNKIDVLLANIEKNVPTDDNFRIIKSNVERAVVNMHDFTHGGVQSIARQYGADGNLMNQRSEDERKELLKLGVLLSSVSYEKLTSFMGNSNSASEIKQLAIQLLEL